jgi:hypothetical protein
MSKFFKTGMILMALTFVIFSCKKAGTGGANTLVISPEHHGSPIKGATAYLKFDTKEQPGTEASDYDLIEIGEQKEDHIHVEGLKPGKYYIYCVGYDSTIFQIVKGGIPLTVKSKSGETAIAVPVTEGD